MALHALKRWFIDPRFSSKKRFLGSLDIFSNLKGREVGLLAQALHARTYRPGEVVFMEGDIGRALFILEAGSVELSRRGPDGAPVHIHTLRPGEFFGEMALLESLPRLATATALETSRLHLLYRTKLDVLLGAEPRIGVSIMTHLAKLLSARLRRASGQAASSPPHG